MITLTFIKQVELKTQNKRLEYISRLTENNSLWVPRYNTLKAENINIDIAPVRENYNDQMFNLPQKRPIRGKVEVRLL
jgi:SH3-like domain-containing protein